MTLAAGTCLGPYEILSPLSAGGMAEETRSSSWLKIDPNFDPLRKNPRFQKLVVGGK
jgi:hypothetical protein